jgi:hypothetical protein
MLLQPSPPLTPQGRPLGRLLLASLPENRAAAAQENRGAPAEPTGTVLPVALAEQQGSAAAAAAPLHCQELAGTVVEMALLPLRPASGESGRRTTSRRESLRLRRLAVGAWKRRPRLWLEVLLPSQSSVPGTLHRRRDAAARWRAWLRRPAARAAAPAAGPQQVCVCVCVCVRCGQLRFTGTRASPASSTPLLTGDARLALLTGSM